MPKFDGLFSLLSAVLVPVYIAGGLWFFVAEIKRGCHNAALCGQIFWSAELQKKNATKWWSRSILCSHHRTKVCMCQLLRKLESGVSMAQLKSVLVFWFAQNCLSQMDCFWVAADMHHCSLLQLLIQWKCQVLIQARCTTLVSESIGNGDGCAP